MIVLVIMNAYSFDVELAENYNNNNKTKLIMTILRVTFTKKISVIKGRPGCMIKQ